MRNGIILFVFSAILHSCGPGKSPSSSNYELERIDSAFLSIVDTVAYQFHNMRPAPGDSTFKCCDSLLLGVFPRLLNIRNWSADIDAFFAKMDDSSANRYRGLYERSKSDSTEKPFKPEELEHTDRYKLYAYEKQSMRTDTLNAIGRLSFSRFYFDDHYGIGVIKVQDAVKNGVIKLVFLTRGVGA